MFQLLKGIVCVSILLFFSLQTYGRETASPELVNLANSKLVQYGSDPILINAVKIANLQSKTTVEVKRIERLWQEKKLNAPEIKHLLDSSLAYYLKGLRKKDPHIEEVYLLDKEGILIGTAKYEEMYCWKDDLGFKSAMTGKLYIAGIEIDEDEERNMVHVVLPVKDKEQTIGALNIGLILK